MVGHDVGPVPQKRVGPDDNTSMTTDRFHLCQQRQIFQFMENVPLFDVVFTKDLLTQQQWLGSNIQPFARNRITRRCLFLLFFFILTISVCVIDAAPKGHEPDHLVPVNPYPGDWHVRYSSQIRSLFKLDPFFFAQMVVRPSFSGEYAIRLHGTNTDNEITTTEKFFLTYSIASKNIWYSMPGHNDQKKQQNVTIAVTTVEFPKPLATRIHQLWKQMLLRTHYSEQDTDGLDGTTFEFAIWSAYGKTWSPDERKSPLLFIELGDSLIEYCKAPPVKRPAAMKIIEKKAEQLEKYLNDHALK